MTRRGARSARSDRTNSEEEPEVQKEVYREAIDAELVGGKGTGFPSVFFSSFPFKSLHSQVFFHNPGFTLEYCG